MSDLFESFVRPAPETPTAVPNAAATSDPLESFVRPERSRGERRRNARSERTGNSTWFNEALDGDTRRDKREFNEAIEAQGIDNFTGLPDKGWRGVEGYQRESEDQARFYADKLTEHFGNPVRVYETELGNKTALVYDNPETGKPTLINPTRLDWGDFTQWEGELPVIAGEIIGGIGGGLLGATAGSFTAPVVGTISGAGAGAVGGSAVGAGAGRAISALQGYSRGYTSKPEAEEILYDALKEAGLSAGLDVALLGMGRLLKRVQWGKKPPITLERMEEIIKERSGDFEAVGVKPTTADLTAGTPEGPRMLREESRVMQGDAELEETFKARRDQNREAIDNTIGDTTERATGGRINALSPVESGQATTELNRRLRDAVEGDLNNAEAVFDNLKMQFEAEGLSPAEAGARVRDLVNNAADSFQGRAKVAYDNLRRKLRQESAVPVPTTSLSKEVGDLADDFSNPFGVGDEGANDLIRRVQSRLSDKNFSGNITPEEAVNSIKGFQREAFAGRGTEAAFTAGRMRNAIEEDLMNALQTQIPNLAERRRAANRIWQTYQEQINEGIFQKILKQEGGGYAMHDSRILPAILKDPAATEKFVAWANSRAQNKAALDVMARYIKNSFNDLVVDNRITDAQFRKFMKDHQQAIDLIGPDMGVDFTDAFTAMRDIRINENRMQGIIGDFNKRKNGIRMTDTSDISRVFDNMLDANKADWDYYVSVLKKDPETRRLFKRVYWTHILDEVVPPKGAGRDIDVMKAFEKLGDPEFLERVESVFGPEYVQQLQTLQNVARSFSETANASQGSAPLLNNLRRAIIAPLSQAARVARALQVGVWLIGERQYAKALLDPERALDVIRAYGPSVPADVRAIAQANIIQAMFSDQVQDSIANEIQGDDIQ